MYFNKIPPIDYMYFFLRKHKHIPFNNRKSGTIISYSMPQAKLYLNPKKYYL